MPTYELVKVERGISHISRKILAVSEDKTMLLAHCMLLKVTPRLKTVNVSELKDKYPHYTIKASKIKIFTYPKGRSYII